MRRKGKRRGWYFPMLSLSNDMTPFDRGVLEGHRAGAYASTSALQKHRDRAVSSRRGILAILLPGRRRYLDGLIHSLDREISRRAT